MDNVTFITDYRQRSAERDKAKREDELITRKAEYLVEYMYGNPPLEVRQKYFDLIDEVDRALDAMEAST